MDLSFPLSEETQALFKTKMSDAAQSYTKEYGSKSSSPEGAEIDSAMIQLVGSYIDSTVAASTAMKDLTSFVSANVSSTEYGRMVMTDALWFWGTQVGV